MDETTTTDVSVDETGAAAQPDLGTEFAAAEASAEQTQPDQSGTAEQIEEDDDVAWLRNKGVDPTDKDAALKAAAKLARDTEREFHKSRQETKNQLHDETMKATEDANVGMDAIQARMNMLEAQQRVESFYRRHPDAVDMDADLSRIVQARPHLREDLDAVYALATLEKRNAAVKQAETKGREAAKAEIARASAATLPKGNAAGPTKTGAPDSFLEGFTTS